MLPQMKKFGSCNSNIMKIVGFAFWTNYSQVSLCLLTTWRFMKASMVIHHYFKIQKHFYFNMRIKHRFHKPLERSYFHIMCVWACTVKQFIIIFLYDCLCATVVINLTYIKCRYGMYIQVSSNQFLQIRQLVQSFEITFILIQKFVCMYIVTNTNDWNYNYLGNVFLLSP